MRGHIIATTSEDIIIICQGGEACVEDQKSQKHHKMPPNYLLHMFSFCYNLNMTVRWEEGGRLLANNTAATECMEPMAMW